MSKGSKPFLELMEKAVVNPNQLTLLECCILDRDLNVSAETLINSCEIIDLSEYGDPCKDANEWMSNPEIVQFLRKALLWPGKLTLSECLWIEDVLGLRIENLINNIHPEEIDIMDEQIFESLQT